MQKMLLLIALVFVATITYAQPDFLLLKKRNRTIQTFYTGYFISVRTKNKQWIDGYINAIANDTLTLKPFDLVRYINGWGMPATDTLWHSRQKLAITDIDAFPRKSQSVNYIKDGTILQAGGAGYIILNVINTLSDGDQLFADNNGTRLGIAAAVFAVGTLLHSSRSPYLETGKKYRLQYVQLANNIPAKDTAAKK